MSKPYVYEFEDILIRRSVYMGSGTWLNSIRCAVCHEGFKKLIDAENHVIKMHDRKRRKYGGGPAYSRFEKKLEKKVTKKEDDW